MYLQHRGDTGATGNHANLFLHVGLDLQLLERALNVKGIAGLQFKEMSGHGAVGVLLNQEIDVAFLRNERQC